MSSVGSTRRAAAQPAVCVHLLEALHLLPEDIESVRAASAKRFSVEYQS